MKKLYFTIAMIFFCFSFLLSRGEESGKITLTLNDCILKALENNLDISVAAFNPEISEVSIAESKERFMPQFRLDYLNQNRNQLGSWWVEGTNYKEKYNYYSIGLVQQIITGGDISLFLSGSTYDTTRSLTTINPTYGGELRLEFTQPLLRNFGPKINRREIIIAQNNRDISLYQLKSSLTQTVYQVEEAYWNLIYATENLKVMEYSLAQSKDRLEMTKEAAKIGSKSPIEVLASETDLASWEERVFSACLQVEMYEDRLKEIINLPSDELGLFQSIIPVDKPSVEKKEISVEEALKIALKDRPEMAITSKEVENSDINVSYYRNQLLPQLDLRASFWYPGQAGDILIYKDDNPLTGEIIDIIKGSRIDALKDIFRLKYDNWRVSLNLTVPLSNFLSRASLARAKIEKDQKLLEREKQKKSIYYEILEAIRELRNNEKKIDTSARYRELLEKQVEAEEEKYKLGLGLIDWLFEYQSRLASAKVSEIKAIIDYKMSAAKLEKALGISLKTKNIKFRNYDF